MKVLGIDLGTNKAAAVEITSIRNNVPKYKTWLLENQDHNSTPDDRFVLITSAILDTITLYSIPDLVIVEYPFNIMGNARVLIEMFGAVRYKVLSDCGCKFMRLEQTRLKKYATGKGKSEKSDMRMQLYREYGIDVGEDVSDAFWIAHFGYEYLHGATKAWRKESIESFKKNLVKQAKVKRAKKK